MNFAQKVEIVLDDEKILSDNIYEIDDFYKVVRELFTEKGMHDVSRGGKLIFISRRGEKDAYCTCGMNIIRLYDSEWARPYIKKMFWYDGDSGEVEDVLVSCAKYYERYGRF